MASLQLADSILQVTGVGVSMANKFKRLAINTVEDLLWHLPTSYDDFRTRATISKSPIAQPVSLQGTFVSAAHRQSWRQKRLQLTEAIFSDSTGNLNIVWFGKFPRKNLPLHEQVYVWGMIEEREGRRQMINPQWIRLDENQPPGLKANYPLTAGLTQWHLRNLVGRVLQNLQVEDWFDENFRRAHKLITIREAFTFLHLPENDEQPAMARRRLAFDELYFLQLSRGVLRARREALNAPCLKGSEEVVKKKFPELTPDQKRAVAEIFSDIEKPHPMSRLLQGEVGSGKTLVAIFAAAAAADSGYQTLILAPTEVLAAQHFKSFSDILASHGYKIASLTRTQASLSGETNPKRVDVKDGITSGAAQIVIGTQALLEKKVELPQLGLVVVDEQHRFGVSERLAAQEKSRQLVPHLLSMTATPIPRSLQLAFMGEIDVSTLKTMPFGPRQIQTMLFLPRDRRRVEEAIRRRVKNGEQVYVVCPLIDPSDVLGVKSVTQEFQRLRKEAFTDTAIGFLHGQMKGAEKNAVLDDFRSGKLSILVSTTVVEVGVDVPNATVMVVEAAERFGLAQLHQLRGRVGRRGREGVCVLFTEVPSALAQKRLEAFVNTADGFTLAELDLKLRGPGEWFGVKQSGFAEFKAADLTDKKIVEEATAAASKTLQDDSLLQAHKILYWRVERLLLSTYHVS